MHPLFILIPTLLWVPAVDDPDPVDICEQGECAGKQHLCPPGEWFKTGDYWCTLCAPDGLHHANDGMNMDDGEQCTMDACDPSQGVVNTPREGSCWLSDLCMTAPTCQGGVCVGAPRVCDDDNPCTRDSCDPVSGRCRYLPVVSGPCDDGCSATPDDVCIDGVCVGVLDADRDGVPNHGPGGPCAGPPGDTPCIDNCPLRFNPDQADANHDGQGDACDTVRMWHHVDTAEKVVALTFDDGYSNQALEEILDALDAAHAYGSFFLNGVYVDDGTLQARTLERLRNRGHLLGNHTAHHTIGQEPATATEEILASEASFQEAAEVSLRPFYRSPAYETAPWLDQVLVETGFTESFRASLDPKDWTEPPPPADRMAACVSETVSPGDIILFHVGPASTPAALSAVLAALTAKGYLFLNLEQILLYGAPAPNPENPEAKLCNTYYQ